MVADLESLIPSACLAIGFVLLVRTILKHQNPRRRAMNRAREEAAEAADPRIMHDQKPLSELKSATQKATEAKVRREKATAGAAPVGKPAAKPVGKPAKEQ
jgi:hypothetical protein